MGADDGWEPPRADSLLARGRVTPLVTEPPLTARKARPSEARVLAELVNHAYGRTDDESGWTSEAELIEGPRIRTEEVGELVESPDHAVLVAEHEGEIVGCVHLAPRGEGVCELGLLSVRPDRQAQGLGRRLLGAGEAYACEHLDAERIVIDVISAREELLEWYEHRGYEPTCERRGFEPEGPQRSLKGPLEFVVLEKEVDGPARPRG